MKPPGLFPREESVMTKIMVDADMKSSLLSTNMAADRLRISVLRVFVEGEFLLEAEREHNEKGQS